MKAIKFVLGMAEWLIVIILLIPPLTPIGIIWIIVRLVQQAVKKGVQDANKSHPRREQ